MATERRSASEVVNQSPTFGSALLSDDFGRRPAGEDDAKALNPLHLEAVEVRDQGAGMGKGKVGSSQLQNPDGATQMFNPVEVAADPRGEAAATATEGQAGRAGMRVMAAKVMVGAEAAGVTDWNTGTDGGTSTKPRVGVPYGSFAGV